MKTHDEAVRPDERTLSHHQVNGPDDVHYPAWEMHPEGDEILILTSGALSVEWQEGTLERSARLTPQAALVVSARVWHRVIVHEPSQLIAITPRQNTVHKRE
jgi:mannose-6-phosphate isomerase-like protein (cupin superfamily)